MLALGITFALLSGVCNGLFTAPMKLIPRWKWENIWLVFIITSCVLMPGGMVFLRTGGAGQVLEAAPQGAVAAAAGFGFTWGFGAILFGLSVDRLGVSLANSLVIGLSSALGSLVPLAIADALRLGAREFVLLLGIATFLMGVWMCGTAGKLREGGSPSAGGNVVTGILFSVGSGVISAIFNIGYTLAQPVAAAGRQLGYSTFDSTNVIWLLMLGAGSLPNVLFCLYLMRRNRSGALLAAQGSSRGLSLSILMGLLWGGSIFLYGAATPLLGDIGPSIGWPLSLAVGLLVANVMGVWLGEWHGAPERAVRYMRFGILTLIGAIVMCAVATTLGPS
jgi:L-rhamnose-H+ transport protein